MGNGLFGKNTYTVKFLYISALFKSQNFAGSFIFAVKKSSCSSFHFPALVIVGICSPVLFRWGEICLERPVCHHAVSVQISEIKASAFFVSDTVGAYAKRRVRIEPAWSVNVEACPVVTAAEIRLCTKSALPAGRDFGTSAQGNE